jgi:serine/threonine protein kinase
MAGGDGGNPKQLMLSRGNSLMDMLEPDSPAVASPDGRNSFAGGILLPEKEIWRIFADMARAIKHVHDKGFIHLDIKPSNFFVAKDRTVKLGDFGLAVHESNIEKMLADIEGDSTYMAPELLNKKLTQKCDIFSLGTTLLEIASSLNLP